MTTAHEVAPRGALEEVARIAATPGVDGIFVGPYDLSLALGRPGVTDDEAVAAIRTVASAARDAGLLAGAFAADRELEKALPELDLLAVDTDVTALRAGVAAIFRP